MVYHHTCEETGVTHIRVGHSTLCGIMNCYIRPKEKAVREKWGCTCDGCQEELEELRKIRKYE